MKLRLSLLAVLCLVVANCGTNLPTKPKPGPVLDLRFDGNLADSSGYHHNATAHGPVSYAMDQDGHPGKALRLTGDSYLTVADTTDLNFSDTSSFTISTWVRTADTSDVAIIHKGPNNPALPGYKIGINHGLPYATITAKDSNVNIHGSTSIADKRWHLVTLTAKPNQVRLYIDTTVVAYRLGATLKADSLNSGQLRFKSSSANTSSGGPPMMINNATIKRWIDTPVFIASMGTEQPPGGFGNGNPGQVPLAIIKDGTTYYCCGTHGLIQSKSGTGQWTTMLVPGNFDATLRHISVKGLYGAAVGDGESVLLYDASNGPSTWLIASVPFSNLSGSPDLAVNVHDVKYNSTGDALFIAGSFSVDHPHNFWYGFVMKSTDHGANWTVLNSPSGSSQWNNPIYCLSTISSGNVLYACDGPLGQLYCCSFTSTSWTPTIVSLPVGATAPDFFTSCDFDGSIGVAVTENGLVYVLTPSAGWSLMSGLTNPLNTNSYFTSAILGGTIWIGGSNNAVYSRVTPNTNANWSSVSISGSNSGTQWCSIGPNGGGAALIADQPSPYFFYQY